MLSSYRITSTKADVTRLKTKLLQDKAKKDLLIQHKQKALDTIAEATEQIGIFDKVQILLQKTSEYARQQAKDRIESVVSEALNVVFGGNHSFVIDLGIRAGQPVADYWLHDGSKFTKLDKPDYDRGGGKVDILSLALRLAIGEMEGITGPLFLDEVGKHVSKEYAPNVAYFLKQYSAQFNRQIVLITHNADLAEIGETSISVTRKPSGESEVKAV